MQAQNMMVPNVTVAANIQYLAFVGNAPNALVMTYAASATTKTSMIFGIVFIA